MIGAMGIDEIAQTENREKCKERVNVRMLGERLISWGTPTFKRTEGFGKETQKEG